MTLEGARRVIETNSSETANQYLRFGWKLLNQYVIEDPEGGLPSRISFVLASMRNLEDTKLVLTLGDSASVNEHLALGWRLIDKYVTTAADPNLRHEQIHFVIAWQREEEPAFPQPGFAAATSPSPLFPTLTAADPPEIEIEVDPSTGGDLEVAS